MTENGNTPKPNVAYLANALVPDKANQENSFDYNRNYPPHFQKFRLYSKLSFYAQRIRLYTKLHLPMPRRHTIIRREPNRR